MTGTYNFAGLGVEISSIYPYIHKMCADYKYDGNADISISVSQSDIDFEREKSAKEDILEGNPVRSFPDRYLETLAVYRKLADASPNFGVFLFHGSAVEVDGECYLFAAPSGTGKSTHVSLWCKKFGSRAVVINDDKPLISVRDDGVCVCGTPWNGKHNLSVNKSSRLKAICFLNRGNENSISEIPYSQAFTLLLNQTHRPQNADALKVTLGLLDKVSSKVTFHKLYCTISDAAVDTAYNGMK